MNTFRIIQTLTMSAKLHNNHLFFAGITISIIVLSTFYFISSNSMNNLSYSIKKSFCSFDDQSSLDKLERIQLATTLVREKINTYISMNSNEIIDKSQTKLLLVEISTDIDFLFHEIDSIHGNDFVKQQRKVIIEEIHELEELSNPHKYSS